MDRDDLRTVPDTDSAKAAAEKPLAEADILAQLVHVNFVKFVEVDAAGQERPGDRLPAVGYIVYNTDCHEFAQWSFQGSDDYTLASDVYDRIVQHHPRLARSIDEWGGFYLCGQWCPVTRDSEVVH
ncbi:hypothetical protein JI721_14750 [Alicyclobacillus cycloheptanicus]|uniref:Uncharacterized protein n=1 Tax=Alicyclobacillus cycloheptanicus TaxID=1457 RepID=A0ABT9XL47_9BACL|nr:hypothetical protein [Alicyclobacillus cycloheptanicus]MDQ0191035.1 hypothetical protein [Alicyclobacillus cycloheptanicus]WDM00925.1 hypothetical protein JI721_14750 [Alicyclobacillus cycloheptanicus]